VIHRLAWLREKTMSGALTIQGKLSADDLRALARAERDARVGRRLLALANALDGMSREAAARAAGMDRQALRDWVIRYNRGGVAALRDAWGGGRPCRMSEADQAALKAIVLAGPDPESDGVSTWRVIDLCRIAAERFGVSYSKNGMTRLLHTLDLSWQTPRPRHAQTDPAAQTTFKKTGPRPSPTLLPSSPRRSGSKFGFSTKPASVRRVA
jgi:transposase